MRFKTTCQITVTSYLIGGLFLFAPTNGLATTIPANAYAQFEVRNSTGHPVTDYHLLLENPNGIALTGAIVVSGFPQGPLTATPTTTDRPPIGIVFTTAGNLGAGANAEFKIKINSNKNLIKFSQSYFTFGDPNNPMQSPPVPLMGMQGQSGPQNPDPLDFTLMNDFDLPIGIRDLRFAVNVPEVPFELDPTSVLLFGPPEPDFVLDANSSRPFEFPELNGGNYIYAEADIFDPTFTTLESTVVLGHQAPTPEPSTLTLLGSGMVLLASICRRNFRSERGRSSATLPLRSGNALSTL